MFKISKLVNPLFKTKNNNLINFTKQSVSTNRHHTRFDLYAEWLSKFLTTKRLTLAGIMIVINAGLFIYVNARLSEESKWTALQGVSWSVSTHQNKEYTPMFTSLMGSYRIDDLILETGILATIGHKLEKLHGSPFMIKMMVFGMWIGICTSLFFVRKIQNKRYYLKEPRGKDYGYPNSLAYRYMSSHGFCMSLLYFWLFKTPATRLLIAPVLVADLAIWGPYYASGALTGIAAGMIF